MTRFVIIADTRGRLHSAYIHAHTDEEARLRLQDDVLAKGKVPQSYMVLSGSAAIRVGPTEIAWSDAEKRALEP